MTLYLWDMSHYDAPSIGGALGEGISVITHKAGGDAIDPELPAWWAGVRTLPSSVVLGTYWVARPDLYGPVTGARNWLAHVDSICPGWDQRDAFVWQVDAEIWNGDPATRPGLAWLNQMVAELVARIPDYQPIVYASRGQYGNALAGLRAPLWNANYPSNAPLGFKAAYAHAGGDTGPGWGKYSGQVPAVWQYSSSTVIGGQGTSDASAFRGTLAEFKQLITPGGDMTVTQADADLIIDRMAGRLKAGSNSDDFVAYMRAVAWQYTGGGLQGAVSTLDALSDTQVLQTSLAALTALVVQQSAASATEIAAALAPLITLPEGVDEAGVERAIRNVLGGLNDAPAS